MFGRLRTLAVAASAISGPPLFLSASLMRDEGPGLVIAPLLGCWWGLDLFVGPVFDSLGPICG